MEYALFFLMWLAVGLLGILGLTVVLAAISDLREKLSNR